MLVRCSPLDFTNSVNNFREHIFSGPSWLLRSSVSRLSSLPDLSLKFRPQSVEHLVKLLIRQRPAGYFVNLVHQPSDIRFTERAGLKTG